MIRNLRIFALGLLITGAASVHANSDADEYKPIVVVVATIDGNALALAGSHIGRSPDIPKLMFSGPLAVETIESQGFVVATEARADSRFTTEGRLRPDGSIVGFQISVEPGMRWLKVRYSPTSEILLEVDLGPILVQGCAQGTLAQDLCATFDSDSDGCKDLVDSMPLVVETEPPVLLGSITPDILWPPNGKLRDVSVNLEVTDNCTESPTTIMASLSSTDATDAGDIIDADVGSPDFELLLRARRSPGKESVPRIYTVTYSAADIAGNIGYLQLDVVVPVNSKLTKDSL